MAVTNPSGDEKQTSSLLILQFVPLTGLSTYSGEGTGVTVVNKPDVVPNLGSAPPQLTRCHSNVRVSHNCGQVLCCIVSCHPALSPRGCVSSGCFWLQVIATQTDLNQERKKDLLTHVTEKVREESSRHRWIQGREDSIHVSVSAVPPQPGSNLR